MISAPLKSPKFKTAVMSILLMILLSSLIIVLQKQEEPLLLNSGIVDGAVLGMAVDNDDNLYAMGTHIWWGEFFITRYDSEQEFTFQNLENEEAITGQNFVVDSENNLIVMGIFNGMIQSGEDENLISVESIATYDVFLAKYDPDGNLLWLHNWPQFSSFIGEVYWLYDGSTALDVDGSGNIYLAFLSNNPVDCDPGPNTHLIDIDPRDDCPGLSVVIKLAPDGSLIWGKYSHSLPGAISALDDGTFFRTASSAGDLKSPPIGPLQDEFKTEDGAFLGKYDSEGNVIWVRSWGQRLLGTESYAWTHVQSIAVNHAGEVYAAGRAAVGLDLNPDSGVLESIEDYGVYLNKFTDDGAYVETIVWNANNLNDLRIAIDSTDRIYFVGSSEGWLDLDPGEDEVLIHGGESQTGFFCVLDPEGNYLWGEGWPTRVTSIAIDSRDNVYVAGGKEYDMGWPLYTDIKTYNFKYVR